MTLERMNELVALTDEEKIIAAIEADGYHNCKGDLWYETFPLMDIFHGKSVENGFRIKNSRTSTILINTPTSKGPRT